MSRVYLACKYIYVGYQVFKINEASTKIPATRLIITLAVSHRDANFIGRVNIANFANQPLPSGCSPYGNKKKNFTLTYRKFAIRHLASSNTFDFSESTVPDHRTRTLFKFTVTSPKYRGYSPPFSTSLGEKRREL